MEYFGLEDSLEEYSIDVSESGEQENGGDHVYAYDFTLDPDGIAFYFSPYGISAYAFGDQTVKILYDEEPGLFKQSYAVEGGYISYLHDSENKYSLGSIAESVCVERTDFDENGYYQGIDVIKGKSRVHIWDLYAYSFKAFIARAGEKDHLYVMVNMDNDYKRLLAFDIDGSRPVQEETDQEIAYTYRDYYDEGSGLYGIMMPIDPEDMDLAVNCDLLSTYNAYGSFAVDEDGSLDMDGKYLTIPEGRYELTLKQDLTTDIVDEDGRVTDKEETISKGEVFTLYRTDGESIVDAKLSDGRIVRMEVTPEYPHKVNGNINEERLFDGLAYAG